MLFASVLLVFDATGVCTYSVSVLPPMRYFCSSDKAYNYIEFVFLAVPIRFNGLELRSLILLPVLVGEPVAPPPFPFLPQSFRFLMLFLGNTTSTVKRNMSSIMRGSNRFSRSLDSSRQGFVLTSINQLLKSSSSIKSYPKSSKQNFLLLGSMVRFTALNVFTMTSCICGTKWS